jgi:hypothetical protein
MMADCAHALPNNVGNEALVSSAGRRNNGVTSHDFVCPDGLGAPQKQLRKQALGIVAPRRLPRFRLPFKYFQSLTNFVLR